MHPILPPQASQPSAGFSRQECYDGGGIDDVLGRLSRIADEEDTTTYAAYTYLGAGTEYYGLDRLKEWSRGTLDQQKDGLTGNPSYYQSFTLDSLGNWSQFTEGEDTQYREHDAANQTGEVTGDLDWVDPAYDDAGNMIFGPKPGDETTGLHFAYDAWNRLTAAWQDDGDGQFEPQGDDTLLAAYEFDGQGRRIEKTVAGSPAVTYDYYFNEDGQVLETRRGGAPDPLDRYVWDGGPPAAGGYAAAPVVRFHDGNTDGDYLDEADNVLYYTQDANWNTTAVVDAAAGEVAERYFYDAYGQAHFADESWTEISWPGSLQNDILYGGYGLDAESGLYHTDYREYHCSLGRWTSQDPVPYPDGMNLYQYCLSSPVCGTDPTGLFDWEKFEKGIWDAGEAESLFLASMPIAGLGSLGQADTQGMVNAGADFLCGLLTSAEGITEDPIFGKLRDYVRTTQGLANTGMMVVGAFSMANSLRGAAKVQARNSAAVRPYEVGTANSLKARSRVGDGIDIDHVGQAHPMEQVVPGFNRTTAPTIALPETEHVVPTLRGPTNITARAVLASDIRNLRNCTSAPNSSLRQLVKLNKQMYPGAFRK